MPDQTSRDEVRRAILQVLSESKGNIFNATDLDTMTILESLFGKYADRIEALITQNRQSLVDQIKAEMGARARYYDDTYNGLQTKTFQVKAVPLDKVTKILESLK